MLPEQRLWSEGFRACPCLLSSATGDTCSGGLNLFVTGQACMLACSGWTGGLVLAVE